MRKIYCSAVVCSLLAIAPIEKASAESQAQLAYDACVKSFNTVYRGLKGYKAIVAGVTGTNYQCFWAWSKPRVSVAINVAMANCQRRQARCFVFADSSGGMNSWSSRISAMGGDDGSRRSAGNDDAAAFLNGFVGALAGVQTFQRRAPVRRSAPAYRPSGGGGGGGGNCPGATIAVDENCHPLH
nr:hypothetical protein [Mesorhizobium sp. LNHC220B00]